MEFKSRITLRPKNGKNEKICTFTIFLDLNKLTILVFIYKMFNIKSNVKCQMCKYIFNHTLFKTLSPRASSLYIFSLYLLSTS